MIEPIVISCESQNCIIDNKVGVFVNLYYKDKYEWCMSYLMNIPHYVDIFLTSSNKDVLDLLEKENRFKNKVTVVAGMNRGRDIGALLVTLREYILKYDLICFVHDKKGKKELDDEYVNRYTECIWDNMLASCNHIINVIGTFKCDEKLGALFPPLVAEEHSMVWHTAWIGNYDNTVAAAKMIGLDGVEDKIKNGYRPSTYGTTFWARPQALKKLFEYEWKYIDFLPEPAPNDYSLTHAIERLLELVVLDSGFVAKNVFSTTYAQTHIKFLQEKLVTHASIMFKSFGTYNFIQDSMIFDWDKKLMSYRKKYIYGAGKIGLRCYRITSFLNITIDAFVVSEENNIVPMNIPVILPEDIEKENSIVIIAIANKDDVELIRGQLSSKGINCCSFLYD